MPATEVPATEALTVTPKQQCVDGRKKFIGGSEAYQLLSESQYGKGCVRQLAYEKLGVEPDFDVPEDGDMEALFRRGNVLEPVVAALYKEETGRDVICGPKDENGFPRAQISKQYSWAGVHYDRMIRAGKGDVQETGDLEIKTRAEGPFFRMLRTGPFTGDFLQTQWANFVTGHSWSAFVALGVFGSMPIRHYDFARDPKIMEIFAREGEAFANKVWGKGELPDHPIPADDPRCLVCSFRKTCRGESVDANAIAFQKAMLKSKEPLIQIENPELAQALRDRQLIKGEIKALDNEPEKQSDDNPVGALQVVEARIRALQRDQEGNRVERAFVIGFGKSYLTPTIWSGLDTAKLKAEQPDIYEKFYVKRATGSETLRVYAAK